MVRWCVPLVAVCGQGLGWLLLWRSQAKTHQGRKLTDKRVKHGKGTRLVLVKNVVRGVQRPLLVGAQGVVAAAGCCCCLVASMVRSSSNQGSQGQRQRCTGWLGLVECVDRRRVSV